MPTFQFLNLFTLLFSIPILSYSTLNWGRVNKTTYVL